MYLHVLPNLTLSCILLKNGHTLKLLHEDVTKSNRLVYLWSTANEVLCRYLKLNLNKYFATKPAERKEAKTDV